VVNAIREVRIRQTLRRDCRSPLAAASLPRSQCQQYEEQESGQKQRPLVDMGRPLGIFRLPSARDYFSPQHLPNLYRFKSARQQQSVYIIFFPRIFPTGTW
jgi:hypothetical protein